MKSRFVIWTLSLILAIASVPMTLQAADAPKGTPAKVTKGAKASKTQKAPAKAKKAPAKAEEVAELPAVPATGTADDYKKYIETIGQQFQKSIQAMIAKAQADGVDLRSDEFSQTIQKAAAPFIAKSLEAVDKALALKDISDDDFNELAQGKVQMLMVSGQMDSSFDVEKKLEEFSAQLRQMKKDKLADMLDDNLFQGKVMKAAQAGDAKGFGKLADVVFKKADNAGKDITPSQAKQTALILLIGKEVKGYKVDEALMPKYLDQFSGAKDEEVRKIAKALKMELVRAEGEKRFKDALGNELKFGGKFMDGTEYKAADYAGKVVLIDFWATWCGPCRGELPNVKKMYKAYHEKGFEVIGVTCDDPDKVDDFKAFLEKNEIPWKQMFDKDAIVPGEQTPDDEPLSVSTYYAINGIPCPILIGKDGKVLSLNARGDELEKQLVKIYGEVKMDDDADDAKAEDKKADSDKANEDK